MYLLKLEFPVIAAIALCSIALIWAVSYQILKDAIFHGTKSIAEELKKTRISNQTGISLEEIFEKANTDEIVRQFVNELKKKRVPLESVIKAWGQVDVGIAR
jgi:hypothetical protein